MAHFLVIGGTGMLREVCRHFCSVENIVSVIARNKKRLEELVESTKFCEGGMHPISLDYSDSTALTRELEKAINAHGPVELAICWIHTLKAPEAAVIIAETIDKQNNQTKCNFYLLLSSATADPSLEKKDISNDFKSFYNIEFLTILLGFKVEGKTSRWLTNNEICVGVILAVENDSKESIIGTVEPWERRP